MRELFQLQCTAQVGEVLQQLNDAPIVGPEELTQCQYGEQLMLCEVLAGVTTGIDGQAALGHLEGYSGQGQRRFGHGSHGHIPLSITYSSAASRKTLGFSTEQGSNKVNRHRRGMGILPMT